MSMRESIRSGGHVLGAHEVDIPTIVFRAGQAYNIRDNSSACERGRGVDVMLTSTGKVWVL